MTMETIRVELDRYEGTWYEIARLPNWFQRNCVRSAATYKSIGASTLSVINECTTRTGAAKSVRGTATVTNPPANNQLDVVFDTWLFRIFGNLLKGQYWIFFVDSDYETAIVGTPSRKYLWILARQPDLGGDQYRSLVGRCRELGFDTARLVKSGAPTSPPGRGT